MNTSLPVNIVQAANPEAIFSNKDEALANGNTETQTVTHSVQYYLQRVYVSANGDATAVIKTGTTGSEAERRVFYLSKSDANQVWTLDEPLAMETTESVVVEITNNNGSDIKVSSTVQGFQAS
jgi:hypothetical protein